MNERDVDDVGRILRRAIAPVETDLRRDLWPRMWRRLEEQPRAAVSWLDWALVALLAAGVLFFPEAIPLLLYHL
jgi:hypothetical protein